jgi:anti-sigma factor RsiW
MKTDLSDIKLSAYLDGALAGDDLSDVETALREDAAVASRLDGLRRANSVARDYFETILNEPVPLVLARGIEAGPGRPRTPVIQVNEDIADKAPGRFPVRLTAIAAMLALLVAGVICGWLAAQWHVARSAAPEWLADVADYHQVYAAEKRHLVEVPAREQEHLETWLTKVIGVPLRVPDLSGQNLKFEGGRLLVAGAAPVAQLMYRHADGTVVALCMIRAEGAPSTLLSDATHGETRLLSWRDGQSAWAVVGNASDPSLPDIARAASGLG